MDNLPKRKQNRLPQYDYSSVGAYFITICTINKSKLLWIFDNTPITDIDKIKLSPEGIITEQGVLQIQTHYPNIFVDKYCIMPDHIHLIIRIEQNSNGRMISAPTISTVIGSLKRWISKQTGLQIWQKSFYDHCIRNQKDYDEKFQYIHNNPYKYIYKQTLNTFLSPDDINPDI